MEHQERLRRILCNNCNHYLGSEDVQVGKVEFYCPRCKKITTVESNIALDNDIKRQHNQS